MIPNDFDIEEFTKNLAEQSKDAFPHDIPVHVREFVSNIVYEYIKLAAKGLENESNEYDAEDTILISQLVGEWMFHKGIDNFKNEIPEEYWNHILQQVSFAVYETAKQAISENKTQDEVVDKTEFIVNNEYKYCILQLAEKNVLKKPVDEIVKQSSLQDYCEKAQILPPSDFFKKMKEFAKNLLEYFMQPISESAQRNEKIVQTKFKFSLLDIVGFVFLSATIYAHVGSLISIQIFYFCIALVIIYLCLRLLSYLVSEDVNKQIQELENVKAEMQDLVSPDRMYVRLGVDILSFEVGYNLIPLVDPELEGELLPRIVALRTKLTDGLGYIIPNVRVTDTSALKEYEYTIKLNGNIVGSGEVYPGRLMLALEQYDTEEFAELFTNIIKSTDPISAKTVYWVMENNIPKHIKITPVKPYDVVINHIEYCAIKYVNEIFCRENVTKIIDLVKAQDPTLVNDLIPDLISVSDLRKIFVNLIREKVSIKNILFIFECLCDYARFSKEPDVLSEKLRIALSRHICMELADEHCILYAIDLTDGLEEKLNEWCIRNTLGMMFKCDIEPLKDIIKQIELKLDTIEKQVGIQPVILCSPKIRLPLFRLLEKFIPSFSVISYSELINEINVEVVETIGESKNTDSNS